MTMTMWERDLTLIDLGLLLAAAVENGKPRAGPLTKNQLIEALYAYPDLGVGPHSITMMRPWIIFAIDRLWSKSFLVQTTTPTGPTYAISHAGKMALQKYKLLNTYFSRSLMGV